MTAGYDLTYGSVKKFLVAVVKQGELLRKFNRGVEAYVQKANDHLHKIGQRCKKELEDAETASATHSSGTMKMVDRVFVERWAWEEASPGKDYREEGLVLVMYPAFCLV